MSPPSPPGDGATAPFPGAIGVSHLRVYDSESPDGLRGGTPHLHTVCSEGYLVTRGHGSVQTLTLGGFDEVPLEPGCMVWFTPGTIHRLVNLDGQLELFVLMQNAGLPEAGDMVITFPFEQLSDRSAYERHAVLPEGETTTAGTGDAARQRRDLGVTGFVALRDAAVGGDPGPLTAFHERAGALVAELVPRFRQVWSAGPAAAAQATGEQLEALEAGDVSHLAAASVHQLAAPRGERRMGCCGTLGTYVPPPT